MNLEMIALFGIIGVILMVLSILFYFTWKSTISQAALSDWNKKQLEIVVKGQQEFMAKLEETNKLQRLVVAELAKKNSDLSDRLEELKKELDSPEIKKQYEGVKTSQVLHDIIRKLEEMRRMDG